MTEYIIKQPHEPSCFTFYHTSGNIGLKMKDDTLSDNEQIEYIGDSLTHEHIHKILLELFDSTTSKLFDGIEHLFRNHTLHEKELAKRSQILCRKFETYHTFIKRKGFVTFLHFYNITQEDIKYANKICNNRL